MGAGMAIDVCGCETGLTARGALDDWNAMIRAFLAHGTATPQRLGAVLEAEPGFALGHATRGIFSLLLGRAEMVEVARSASDAADAALSQGGGGTRARLWCDGLRGWLDGRPSAAVAAMDAAIAVQPRDTLSLKAGQAIRFLTGDAAGMRAAVESVMDAHRDHPLEGFVLGCHAFTLEETGDFDNAERAGHAGLDLAPDDAWGLHAVTHVHDMRADAVAGLALIDDRAGAWLECNNFRYHVWWHKALMLLDAGRTDDALHLYDTRVRAERTDDYRDIANATSLLMRLELEGVSVGDRWCELADLSAARTHDACLVFADLHYMLALAGDDRAGAKDQLVARLASSGRIPSEAGAVAACPGHSAAEGLAAFGAGRYDAAFAALSAARPHMQDIGGSIAQRDVFERITIDAGLRAGRLDDVSAVLADRTRRRGGTADRFTRLREERLAHARVADRSAPVA